MTRHLSKISELLTDVQAGIKSPPATRHSSKTSGVLETSEVWNIKQE
jgi:hypothetical protein